MRTATNKIVTLILLTSLHLISLSQIDESIKFRITDPLGNTDETIIRIEDNATQEFDGMWDAWKLFTWNDAVPSLYSKTASNEDLAINSIPTMQVDSVIHLWVRARINGGSYLMETEQLGAFPTGIKIAIKDLETGIIYELNQNQTFNFEVLADPNNDQLRFQVFYSPKATVNVFENELMISNPDGFNWSYIIKDSVDNTVESNLVFGNEIEIFNLLKGLYSAIITDEFNLVDTLFFEILFEEEDTLSQSDTSNNATTSWIVENNFYEPILKKNDLGYYVDLGSENSEKIVINYYSLSGGLIRQEVKFSSDGNVQLYNPTWNGIYIVELFYQNKIYNYKLSGI